MIPYRARLDVVSAASGRARPWSQARGTVYVSVRHRPIFPYIKVIAARKGRGVTTAEFIALAEEVSGRQLDALFTTWLDTPHKPI
jgi:hypothetical protein